MEKFTPLAKILHCRRHWRHWQIPPLSSFKLLLVFLILPFRNIFFTFDHFFLHTVSPQQSFTSTTHFRISHHNKFPFRFTSTCASSTPWRWWTPPSVPQVLVALVFLVFLAWSTLVTRQGPAAWPRQAMGGCASVCASHPVFLPSRTM